MNLILVRHGESIGNQQNRMQGQEDYDLTDLGRQQALLTGARLLSENVSAVYCSPLLRARNTALSIAGALGLQPVELAGLSEYHFGEMSGQTYAEVRERFTAAGATPQPLAERVYPGEEGRDNFFNRVTLALAAIAERHAGENVAVVSHGGPIALFCQYVLGLPYTRPMPFGVDNCSLTVIEADVANDRRILLSLNDVCHLESLRPARE